MPGILKRENAPLSDEAWKAIDEEASRSLKAGLTARKVVDFSGPHGWELGAVNLGRVNVEKGSKGGDVPWGIRQVLPLIEIRIPFTLNRWELDNVSRGADNPDLDPLVEAATKAARFEDGAVLNGFKVAQIEGIADAAATKSVALPKVAADMPAAVAKAVEALVAAGIGGPYHLLLGSEAYFELVGQAKGGYPPRMIVQQLLEGGDVIHSPVLKGGLLITGRGGDFTLTVGKDFSVGYASHTTQTVDLFLTESFTFHVAEPKGAIVLKPGNG